MRRASHDKVNREQREWFNCESAISKVGPVSRLIALRKY
jgi:hypothetical protein